MARSSRRRQPHVLRRIFPSSTSFRPSPELIRGSHQAIRERCDGLTIFSPCAPAHLDDSLPTLDELPLERFTGPALIVDARSVPARGAIGVELFDIDPVPGSVVLIVTGWSARWGSGDYLAHPYLSPEAAQALVDSGIRTVGIDAPSIDPSETDDLALPAHRILCGAHAVIAENLTGLDRLLAAQTAGQTIEISLFPLRLSAADGAPIRAVARVGDR
ncbi:cyclase family protein [Nocardia sp. MW-W600-9]